MLHQNYNSIIQHISQMARQCGRDPQNITLLCVSKGIPLSQLLSVYQSGCRQFGESRVQEALKKMEALPKDIVWHLIGSLQKNKVKQAIQRFPWIHSVDSLEIAQHISKASIIISQNNLSFNIPKIFLQVNVSGELTKHGFNIDLLRAQAKEIATLHAIEIQGLMTIAPLTDNESVIRNCFRTLRLLQDELFPLFNSFNHPFKDLSMGMSNDYPIAIQEGATFLRIGTAIFK